LSRHDENEDNIQQERMERTIPKSGMCRHPDCSNAEHDRLEAVGLPADAQRLAVLDLRVPCKR
jgi:hypothetical protein